MSNELTIPRGFSVERVSKAGRITERDALGVLMSGNKDERVKLCGEVIKGIWAQEAETGNFHPLLENIVRIFPEAAPWMTTVRGQRFPSKAQCMVTFEAVSNLTSRNGSPYKGEKAMMVGYCTALVQQYHDDIAAKEERKAAYEAKQLGMVEEVTEVTEVTDDATDDDANK